nr:hypothetical protein [Parvibaculum lavamentivorans]
MVFPLALAFEFPGLLFRAGAPEANAVRRCLLVFPLFLGALFFFARDFPERREINYISAIRTHNLPAMAVRRTIAMHARKLKPKTDAGKRSSGSLLA